MSDINNNESVRKVLFVTIILCLICSVLVASTAVILKERQEKNKQLDMEKSILEVSGLVENVNALSREEIFKISKEKLIPALVDLRDGTFYKGSDLSVDSYDFHKALKNTKLSHELPVSHDPALIKRQEYYSKVFMVKNKQEKLSVLILPIRGYGLWSTLYGFLALKGDLKTIQGLTFYDQKETPGLGGEVDNPRWKEQWHNKSIELETGKLGIRIVKPGTSMNDAMASHQVDAISGATLTSRGVNHLINFWLSHQGFGPFIKKLQKGDI